MPRQVIFSGFFMTLLFLAACALTTPTMPHATTAVTTLTLAAPTTIQAGAPVTISVTTDSPDSRQSVRLALFDAYGATILQDTLTDGHATFLLPGTRVQTTGQMRLVAQVGAVAATATLRIEAGAPVEPVLTLVGPRSITADGKHWAMLVAAPQDQYGNPVADETPVTVRIVHPARTLTSAGVANADVETQTTTTAHLIAWQRLYSRTKAGRMSISANAGAAHSPERTVLAVPGAPTPFALTADPIHLTADGQQLVTIRTAPLVDTFGNLLLDGTSVTFWVEEENGAVRTLPAQTIGGTATTPVQAPAVPGRLTIRAVVLDIESQPLTLPFTAGLAVTPFTITVTIGEETVRLQAGPLVGHVGQYIPDGSAATFQLRPAQSEPPAAPVGTDPYAPLTVTTQVDGGFTTAHIRRNELRSGEYLVMVTVGAAHVQTHVVLSEPP